VDGVAPASSYFDLKPNTFIAFMVCPLVNECEMPKVEEVDASDQVAGKGGLVHLKYTYRYRNLFGELDDDWLDVVEATSNEMSGNYSKREDEALTTAFVARGKRRLNRVFDVIGFVYPDYSFPVLGKGKKRKSALKSPSAALKKKKAKILAKRSKSYFEDRTTVLPALATSSKEVTIEIVTTDEPKLEPPRVQSPISTKVLTFFFVLINCVIILYNRILI
jgi:hypothetical protein